MRALLILAAIICFSASAFAQTGKLKVGGKPLKQVKPLAPMGCKLVGTVKGTKLWAGDCVAASELRGTTPTPEPEAPAQAPEPNPPPLTNNRQYGKRLSRVCACARLPLRNTHCSLALCRQRPFATKEGATGCEWLIQLNGICRVWKNAVGLRGYLIRPQARS